MPLRLHLAALAACLFVAASAVAAPGYYRDPALHGDTVVFTAEGDLWSASLQGGLARRLTSHPAEEAQSAISPDGRHIAFVASYDGAPDVYVMPLAGGEPRRLSFDGGRVWVAGFNANGEVVYASENVIGPTLRRVLREVDVEGAATRELPLADAREAGFDGQRLWFTRYGLQLSTDNAQDYRGGAMAQLWRWDRDTRVEAVRVAPELDANLHTPMWWNGRLYAISDAGGRSNLWSMDADGGDRRALTTHVDFDVRGARMDRGRIVYQRGADLHLYDTADGSDRALAITLGSDYGQRRTRFISKPLAHLGSVQVGADGKRVVLTARGNVALAGTGALRRVDVLAPPDARLREATLSHDGKTVYAIADAQGRSEVWSFPADGSPGGRALTTDGDAHRWRLYPSPDGRWLAHDNKRGELGLIDLRDGSKRQLDHQPLAGDDAYDGVAWSHDARYLAVARADTPRQLNQIVLLDTRSERREVLTSDRYESFSPAFSRDGRWLYFLSNRSFQSSVPSPWGDRNTGPFFDRRTRIYALALQPGSRFPFQPADELVDAQNDDAPDEDEKKESGQSGKGAPPTLPAIVFDGLRERLFEVPMEAGNFRGLAATDKQLYFLQRDAAPGAKGQLMTLAIGNVSPKPELFMADVQQFALSADGSTLLMVKSPAETVPGAPPGEMLLVEAGAKAPSDLAKAVVRIADWSLRIDPSAEWRQMFDDAWRLHREFSFDPAMRGQDWVRVRARYAPLLERVNDRSELDDLLAQMSSELGILHSQVRGGPPRQDPDTPVPAALGAMLATDAEGVRLARIYRSDPEVPGERGPLLQPGVDARDGDRLVAINGHPVRGIGDVADRLRQQAGQQVLLTLKRGSAAEHRTVVVPVRLERDATLRYGDWVEATRQKVQQAAEGRIGYLHLRAMTTGDMATFVREFYANVERDGLIIDVRRNRGGNIDSWIIEKLLRRAWAFWQPPVGAPYPNMQQTFRGHLAVLADPFTYSDGETFAAGVKALKLGPVIGKRTAGAGIWLSDRNRLADNGIARVAEFGQFDMDGNWLIEGRGVVPDIEVDNLPLATALGGDAQLDAAIGYLQQRLEDAPITPLKARPIPARGTTGR